MTVREIIAKEQGNYVDVEVNKFTDRTRRVHSDFIAPVSDIYYNELYLDSETYVYYLMDQSEYDRTILANATDHADFGKWYGDSDAKVLVIMLDYTWDIDDSMKM